MNINFYMVLCVIILLDLSIFSLADPNSTKRKASECVMKPQQMTEEEILECFSLLDTDKDGWLTVEEFIRHMDLNDVLNEEIKKYFSIMGTDNRLAYEEFHLLMTKNIDIIYKIQENTKIFLGYLEVLRNKSNR